MTRVLDDGGGDLAVVNAARARAGESPSALRWECQHSCSPELGEYMGPNLRVAVRMGRERAEALLVWAAGRAGAGASFAMLLAQSLERLGLPGPPVPEMAPHPLLSAVVRSLPLANQE